MIIKLNAYYNLTCKFKLLIVLKKMLKMIKIKQNEMFIRFVVDNINPKMKFCFEFFGIFWK